MSPPVHEDDAQHRCRKDVVVPELEAAAAPLPGGVGGLVESDPRPEERGGKVAVPELAEGNEPEKHPETDLMEQKDDEEVPLGQVEEVGEEEAGFGEFVGEEGEEGKAGGDGQSGNDEHVEEHVDKRPVEDVDVVGGVAEVGFELG